MKSFFSFRGSNFNELMILCLLGVTSLSPPAIAETEGDLNICTNSFVSTGRTFAPGDELDIRASGRINFGFVAGSGGPNGIDFPADYNYFPDVSHGRLMGRIKQPGMEDLEGWFFIGEARKITVPASGILEFLVNDKKPGDNSGQFCIQVINVNSSNPQASRTNPARQTRRERASTPQTRRERASTPQIVEGKLDRNSEIMLQNNAYFNVHEFTGRAGQQIAVELTSSEFDAYLFLADPTGKTLAADDDGGGGSNARILMRLPLDGTYHVVVTSAVGSTVGSYRLVWSETAASTNTQPTQQQLSPFMQLLSEGLGIPTGVTDPLEAMAENPYFRLYYFLMGGRARSSEEIVRELRPLSNQISNDTSRNNAVVSTQSDPAEQLFLQVNRLYRAGQFKEATPLAEQLVALRRRQVGNAHPKVVQNLGNLAILYASQGRYDEAEQLLEEALAIDRRLGRENLSNSASFSNLALLYESLGRYSEAEQLHKEALAVRRSQFGEEHPRVAQSLGNLANSYLLQGRYNEAEPLFQAALDLYRRLDRAALEGYRRYERTRVLRRRTSNNDSDRISPNVAFASNKLAQLYYFQGRYNEAEPLYREALAAFRSRLGREHPDVANVLNNLALLLHAQGRYAEAEPLYQEALAIDRKQRGNEHPNLASTANHLATLYAARNQTDTALDSLNQGLSIEEVNLSNLLITGSERQKRQYLGTIADSLDLALSLHLQAAPNNSEAANLAFTTLLRRKGRILDAVADNMQILRQNLTPENRQLLDRLSTKRSELAAAIFNPPPDIADASYRKHLATLKGEAEQLETQLARASAEFRTDQQPVTLEGIQALIPSNAALIEIVHYRPVDFKASLDRRFGVARYAAYILNASGTPEWVDLGDVEPIDTAARRFRQELNNPNNLKAARQRARELDALVMEPIRARLGNVEHLLISPDSQLNLVPFAALVDEQERYLIQTHKITYLTTGRDLRNLERSRPAQSPPLILADPNYDQPGSSGSTRAAQRSQDLGNLRFGPLPGAAAEAEALRGLLPNATLLTGDKATENAIKQTPAPEILHIATHGFFLADVEFALPRDGTRSATIIPTPTGNLSGSPARPSSTENPLLRSGLALAGFNVRASAGEDGVLTALEAAGLSLRGTRLVVMSACETGVGAVANGEGVYGLRRAFAIAGAESQLMSLWQVDDYSTAELMELYYSRILKGEERSEALRQVQLDLLAAPAYEHPYYWASFLFSGDWRPIPIKE